MTDPADRLGHAAATRETGWQHHRNHVEIRSRQRVAPSQWVERRIMHVDSGDTAWVLVCAALVLLMTPGLAFFYAGMVRSKHVLGMLMQNFVSLAVVSVTWTICGYALAFGADAGFGLIGDLRMAGLARAAESVPGFSSLT